MQKKLIYIIIGVAVVTSASSFYLGRSMSRVSENTAASIEKLEEKEQSTQIAIVNQDDGTEYKENNVNYATDLIKAVENDFVLTNREAAQKGVKDGKYAAMVILPGNFSKNITSINDTTPSKVEIYYEVNNDLDKVSSILVKSKISDFEKKLNDKLSLMYVSSILDELHSGQDYISEVLKNDNKDLESINEINNIDLLKGINLTELEKQNINLESLDLSKNFNENVEIMNQIDKLYREKMVLNDNNVEMIKTKLLSIITDDTTGVKAFREELEAMTTEEIRDIFLGDYSYDFDSLSSKHEINVDEINEFIESLSTSNSKVDDVIKKYKEELLSELETKGISAIDKASENLDNTVKKTEEINTSIDGTISKVKNEEATTNNSEEDKFSSRNINSLNQEYLLYGKIVEEIARTNPEVFDNAYSKVNNNVSYDKIYKDTTKDSLSDNTYLNSEELKEALKTGSSCAGNSFIENRSQQYIKNEIQKNKDIEGNLNSIKEKTDAIKQSSESIRKNEDYNYLASMFAKDSKLEEKLKIKDLLTDENAEARKQELLEKVKENNKATIDYTKNLVKDQIEKNLIEKGAPNGGNVVKLFDDRYMNSFNALVNDIDLMDKTVEDPKNDEKVLELWNQYSNNNQQVNMTIETQIAQYHDAVLKNKLYADNHIEAMKTYLDQGIKAAQDNIDNSLEDAKSNKKKTYENNKKNLGALSGILSNTRVGTVENKEVYKFIVNPLSSIKVEKVAANKNSSSEISKVQNDENDIIKLIFLLSLTGAITLQSLEFFIKYKKKQSK